VSSWRRTASEQTQADLDGLFNLALERATQVLRDGGRLVPFAAAVSNDGVAELFPGPVEPAADRGARAVLTALYADARQHLAEWRAVAFTADITLAGGRGIRIEAEHRDGIGLALRVPYQQRFLGGIKLGTMTLDPGPTRFWKPAP
jgi:hypothetical protein